MGKPEQELAPAELDVLKMLWELGPSTVREVMAALHKRDRKVAYTTVLTFLTRLEQKAYIKSDRSGVAYVYTARTQRDNVVETRVKTVIQQLFDGAAAPMVLHLMKTERFSSEELEELQTLIDELASKPGATNKKKSRKTR